MGYLPESGQMTWISVTGTVCISSAYCQILGYIGQASVTQGNLQLFAGTTTSASASPVITPAVTGAFARFPVMCSGTGLTIKYTNTQDPNLLLFWNPIATSN